MNDSETTGLRPRDGWVRFRGKNLMDGCWMFLLSCSQSRRICLCLMWHTMRATLFIFVGALLGTWLIHSLFMLGFD